MLGVPEELGGAVSERSAVTSALVTEALGARRHGPRRRRALPRGRRHRDRPMGRLGPAGHLPARARSATTFLPQRSRSRSRTRCSTRSSSRPRRPGPGTASSSTAEKSLVARGADSRALRRRRRRSTTARRSSSSRQRRRASSSSRSPRWASAPPATANLKLDGVEVPAEVAARRRRARTSTRTASGSAASPGPRSPSAPRRPSCDYVIPYVNERIAFGEPISHRQAVAFKVADMATELEGMRLVMLRAASRVDQGLDFARESRSRPPHRRPEGHADRLGRRSASRRAWLHQGTPR